MQKCINLVDLVKSFPTSIRSQKSASIQPRTSHPKVMLKERKREWKYIKTRVIFFFAGLQKLRSQRKDTARLEAYRKGLEPRVRVPPACHDAPTTPTPPGGDERGVYNGATLKDPFSALAPQFKFRAVPISNSRNLIQIFKFPVSPKFSNFLGN